MATQRRDERGVLERLEILEKQNRRMKAGGLVVLAAVGALILTGQASTKKRTVEAEKFVLTGASGKIQATLSTGESGPELALFDGSGFRRVSLGSDGHGAALWLDGPGKSQVMIVADSEVSVVQTTGPGGKFDANISARENKATLEADVLPPRKVANSAWLGVTTDGAGLGATDNQGFSTVLGNTPLLSRETGESLNTSAASLVLFGKSGKVIWRAP